VSRAQVYGVRFRVPQVTEIFMYIVNLERRRYLVAATTLVATVGAVGISVPFVKSWQPSARARMSGAPVEVDIRKLEPGRMITVKWRGKPVWVLRRTEANLETLQQTAHLAKLRDPDSAAKQQPDYAQNQYRSIRSDVFVAVGICTHLGCVPTYLSSGTDEGEAAMFFCPCHGSKLDLAGRVFKNVPAPINLFVPPYRYNSGDTLDIGTDGDKAKGNVEFL
jgi:ubiquinol-cytochrome c reductase iron-sulfur subunit